MTGTPKRRTDRLTQEQRAQVRATVAAWAPLTEAQRVQVATLLVGSTLPEALADAGRRYRRSHGDRTSLSAPTAENRLWPGIMALCPRQDSKLSGRLVV